MLKDAWANYRDESFVEQFLSPKLMRDMRLFALHDNAADPALSVSAIHDERGYRRVRAELARGYDVGRNDPNIQVVDAALKGDRKLTLLHYAYRGVPLHEATREQVLAPHRTAVGPRSRPGRGRNRGRRSVAELVLIFPW